MLNCGPHKNYKIGDRILTTGISDNKKINSGQNFAYNSINNMNSGVIYNPSARPADRYKERYSEENKKYPNKRRRIVTGKDLTTPLKEYNESIEKKRLNELTAIKRTAASGVRIKTINIQKKPFPVTAMFITLIVVTAFLYFIYSQIVLNEYTAKISDTKKAINKEQQQQVYLDNCIDAKENMLEFEKIAVEKLGMVKENLLPKKYIDIKEADKTEVIKNNDDITEPLKNIFSAAAE